MTYKDNTRVQTERFLLLSAVFSAPFALYALYEIFVVQLHVNVVLHFAKAVAIPVAVAAFIAFTSDVREKINNRDQ